MDPITLILAFIVGAVGGGLASSAKSPTAIADKAADKVYRVEIAGNFIATAFALENGNEDKFLVTAGHVCDGMLSKKIKPLPQTARSGANVIKIDNSKLYLSGNHDLCVISKLSDDAKAFKLSSNTQELEEVVVVGHPAGIPLAAIKGSVVGSDVMEMPTQRSKDKCSGSAYSWQKVEMVTMFGPVKFEACMFKAVSVSTTLTVAPGNSGSPVLNADGEVIGVLSAMNTNIPAGFGVVVPVEILQKEIK
jgi:S1-C subfamily serine protease